MQRVRYEETIKDIRTAVAKALGVAPESQLLFWHKAELMPEHDSKTLLEMGLHTGFALQGYDTVRSRSAVEEQSGGLCVCPVLATAYALQNPMLHASSSSETEH